MKLTRAIVRPPAPNFSEGLTTSNLGKPNYQLALQQHQAYCTALERCGLTLTRLAPDANYPDSTFVEDTAVITERAATITRPGATSRIGEIESTRELLGKFFPMLDEIESPGALDGGDVCEAGNHFLVGISERTNEAGARQLAKLLAAHDYTSAFMDIRVDFSLLHLKSGIAYLGDNFLAVVERFANRPEFADYEIICVDRDEEYAANCVRVNEHVLIAAGFPKFEKKLRELNCQTITLGMSEFQKMDGGLSCLSLRF